MVFDVRAGSIFNDQRWIAALPELDFKMVSSTGRSTCEHLVNQGGQVGTVKLPFR